MNFIKSSSMFFFIYVPFTFFSIYLNRLLGFSPTVGLNIAVLVITTLIVIRTGYINLSENKISIFFSIFGSGCCVITLYILAALFDEFIPPSLGESLSSFIFNAVVMYIVINLSLKKSNF